MADGDVKLGRFQPADLEARASEWEEYKSQFDVHLDSKGLYNAEGRRKVHVGQLLKHMLQRPC